MDKTLPRMRTVQEAYDMLKASDPNTRITAKLIRRMVAEGTIPATHAGRKILVNYDTLLDYLSRPCQPERDKPPEAVVGVMRPVPIRTE